VKGTLRKILMVESLNEKLRGVRLVILDVDGVLTDGRIIMDEEGKELRCFDVKDGFGVRALVEMGVLVGVISGRAAPCVERRLKQLGVTEIFQGIRRKREPFRQLLRKYGLRKEETLFVADDVYDMPLLEEVGVKVAVADAVEEVRRMADWVTRANGGRGAVREVAEAVLKAKGLWKKVVAKLYSWERENNL